MDIIIDIKPSDVLDIGVGYGKYGALIQEYLNAFGRKPSGMKFFRCLVYGIEGYKFYKTDLWNYYSQIYIGDAATLVGDMVLKEWRVDLTLLIDVLEHFSFAEGLMMLLNLKEISKYILISTPRDVKLGAAFNCYGYDNPLEKHKFQWLPHHFRVLKPKYYPNENSLIMKIKGYLE